MCPIIISFVSPVAEGTGLLPASVRTAMSTLLAVLNMQGIDVDLQLGAQAAVFPGVPTRATT